LNRDRRYQISEDIMEEVIDDEILLMNSQAQLFYKLNGTAAVLWSILKEYDETDTVYKEMKELFSDVDTLQMEKDIDTFFNNMVEQQILSIYE
jgi:hypothetical protein